MNNGILDPEGINLNPLTDKIYSEQYKEFAKKWSKLPAYNKRDEIIDLLKENQIILIISSTGSGKTVLLPKFLLHIYNYKGRIAITLPKQIIAKSAAEYAAITLDVKLGEQVGYKFKGSDKRMDSSTANLLYCTDGTIVSMLLKDPMLKNFDALILDELHEMRNNMSFLIYLLKETLLLRPDFKVILMSATIDKNIFVDYFKNFKFDTFDLAGERLFPIETYYLEKPITDKEFIPKGIEIITKLLKDKSNDTAKDILFFVTSVNETFECCRNFEVNNEEFCIEVFAGINDEKQKIAQNKNEKRKIIIATNVAESSLTIDGIKYVIDSGLELKSYYDPKIRSKVLNKGLITQAQAKQRIGRAGRTENGYAYLLYTQNDFENMMKKYPDPEIRTSNILDESLKLLVLPTIETTEKLEKVFDQFLVGPLPEYQNVAIKQLMQLGLVDPIPNSNNFIVNNLGKIIHSYNLEAMQGLSVYASFHFNCHREVISIIALLDTIKNNLSELFIIPNIKDDKSNNFLLNKFNKAKNNLSHKFGDHLSLLKIFLKYMKYSKNVTNNSESHNKINQWTYDNFLKKDILLKAKKTFKKLMGTIKNNNIERKQIDNLSNYNLDYRIIASFLYGYKINIAFFNSKNNKYSTPFLQNIGINKNSFININEKHKEILFNEIFTSSGKSDLVIISQIPQKSKTLALLL
jgi:pre-mRNA-splicing factor ATP-dependent RNA helicase DHX15/PRP43